MAEEMKATSGTSNPNSPVKGQGKKADGWVAQHKVALIGGGIAVALVIIVIWRQSHSSSSGATSSTTLPTGYLAAGGNPGGMGYGYASGYTSSLNAIQSELGTLTNDITALTGGVEGGHGPEGFPPIKNPKPKKGGGGTGPVTVGGPHATKDLYQLAKQYGISEAELLKKNPGLKKYAGSGKPIPVKTKIKV